MKQHEKIVILDFGGQYAHLIASRIRRLKVLAEIADPKKVTPNFLKKENVKGLILSGGPQSVFEKNAPHCDPKIFDRNIPILGICYGHQFLAHNLGGKVIPGKKGEYGRSEVTIDQRCPLFKNIPKKSVFWMNHMDEVARPAPEFINAGRTLHCAHAALYHPKKNIFSVQFHLEVTHSVFGIKVLENFIEICGMTRDWTMNQFWKEQKEKLKTLVGKKNIFLFVSGGVDSSVSFLFLTKIFGAKRVRGLFVDTGMLRKNEVSFVEKSLRKLGAHLTVLREKKYFLQKLKGTTDPEQKREIIGHAFLEVQQKFFQKYKLDANWLLAQGTIYPDTIETGGTRHASKIKTHHNRAPQVQKLINQGKIIEPLKELYKDEVRELGKLLKLPKNLIQRHPFPGPGLGVRILCSEKSRQETIEKSSLQKTIALPIKSVGVQGDFRTYKHPGILLNMNTKFDLTEYQKKATEVINQKKDINRCVILLGKQDKRILNKINVHKKTITEDRILLLQNADHIVTQTLKKMGIYKKVWQFPVVLVPLTINNKGNESIILRPIDSVDAMSASVGKLPKHFFDAVTKKILKEKKISGVFLDITSKPPGTIEWE